MENKQAALAPGSLLQSGKYKIIKKLGQGGFGITYKALQSGLDREVTIKEFFFKQYCERESQTSLVKLSTSSNAQLVKSFKEKFEAEARKISKLEHDNILTIYDIFSENGTAYFVMEYVDGCSLKEMVEREGALNYDKAEKYIRAIGNALIYIHNQNITHLDVKPGNIMWRKKDGHVYLIDFGVSKHYDSQTGDATTDTPVGISHGYSPTEQYKKGGVQQFSPSSDVYALAATLFTLLSGKTPPEAIDVQDFGLPLEELKEKKVPWYVIRAIDLAMKGRKDRTENVQKFLEGLEVTTEEPYPPYSYDDIIVIDEDTDLIDEEEEIRKRREAEREAMRKVAELKRKEEEERQRKEAERKAEEERKRKEAERKRREEEERKRREEEERQRKEAERKAEEERKRKEAERKRREEEERQRKEAELKRKEEEERKRKEAELKRKEEEERKRKEAELKRESECGHLWHLQYKALLKEEEERKRKEAERKAEEERKRKEEEERKRKEIDDPKKKSYKTLIISSVIGVGAIVSFLALKDSSASSIPDLPVTVENVNVYKTYVEDGSLKSNLKELSFSYSGEVKYPEYSMTIPSGFCYSGTVVTGEGSYEFFPQGKGIADYSIITNSQMKSYVGNFNYGKRQDNNAVLTYVNGDKFVGEFRHDTIYSGKYTIADDGLYFEGLFRKNAPYNGTWYEANGQKYMDVEDGVQK